jgi:hypothetical protein
VRPPGVPLFALPPQGSDLHDEDAMKPYIVFAVLGAVALHAVAQRKTSTGRRVH